jgi:hypothetical protein
MKKFKKSVRRRDDLLKDGNSRFHQHYGGQSTLKHSIVDSFMILRCRPCES